MAILRFSSLALIVSVLSLTAPAQASIFGMKGTPDITSGGTKITYDADTDFFNAAGHASAIDFDGIAPPDYSISGSKQWLLTATIDGSGNASSGSLTISGKIDGLSISESMLLSGNLVDFEYQTGTTVSDFGFVFSTTGGELADQFGGTFVVLLHSANEQLGNLSFVTSFQNYWEDDGDEYGGMATSDTFAPVPEPASLLIWTVLGLAIAVRRNHCRRATERATDRA